MKLLSPIYKLWPIGCFYVRHTKHDRPAKDRRGAHRPEQLEPEKADVAGQLPEASAKRAKLEAEIAAAEAEAVRLKAAALMPRSHPEPGAGREEEGSGTEERAPETGRAGVARVIRPASPAPRNNGTHPNANGKSSSAIIGRGP